MLLTSKTIVTNENERRQDELKRATKELKAQGLRVIKKPRYKRYSIVRYRSRQSGYQILNTTNYETYEKDD